MVRGLEGPEVVSYRSVSAEVGRTLFEATQTTHLFGGDTTNVSGVVGQLSQCKN